VDRRLVVFGAVFAFLGVALGAFGAHALKDRLSSDMLAVWQTGVFYEQVHSLGVILAGLLFAQFKQPLIRTAGLLFLAGILVFSGSLYALALSGVRVLGAITPFGGVCFLAGWACFAVGASKAAPSGV
jgi:uncharacterized membrane protein YgdD (TMEM256/DUF423 family)